MRSETRHAEEVGRLIGEREWWKEEARIERERVAELRAVLVRQRTGAVCRSCGDVLVAPWEKHNSGCPACRSRHASEDCASGLFAGISGH